MPTWCVAYHTFWERDSEKQIAHLGRRLEIMETMLKASVHGTEALSYLYRREMLFCWEFVKIFAWSLAAFLSICFSISVGWARLTSFNSQLGLEGNIQHGSAGPIQSWIIIPHRGQKPRAWLFLMDRFGVYTLLGKGGNEYAVVNPESKLTNGASFFFLSSVMGLLLSVYLWVYGWRGWELQAEEEDLHGAVSNQQLRLTSRVRWFE